MISKRLADCQRVIGYHFTDPGLLEIALTHSSVRTPDKECNERLEFLGDSVLGLAITDEIYRRLPDQQEGELTRIKSAVVSRGALYRASTRMGLVRFIEVAKGVGRREELPVSLTANLVESIIGAIHLDAGFFPAREFILRHLGPELEDVLNDRVAKNYKSILQHEAQERMGVTPVYRSVEEEGSDHRRRFVVAAMLRGTEYGRASGMNKKEAEQEAARHAIEALRSAGGGRRRRSAGRGGDGRGDDVRGGDAREHERGADAQASDGRPAGEPARAAGDDAAWKSWAESGAAARPSASPSRGEAPAPYVIGPEADEGWGDEAVASDAPSRTASPSDDLSRPPRAPRRDAPATSSPSRPAAAAFGASLAGAPTSPPLAPASPVGAPEPAPEAPRGRSRRGRRGAPDEGPAAAAAEPSVETSARAAGPAPRAPRGRAPRRSASPVEERAPAVDPSLAAVFTDAGTPSASAPAAPPPSRAEPADAPRRASARKPAGRASRAGAPPPVATPDAPAPAPVRPDGAPDPARAPESRPSFDFGAGVAPSAPAPSASPAPIERAVDDRKRVPVRKGPPAPPPPPPPSSFGEGL